MKWGIEEIGRDGDVRFKEVTAVRQDTPRKFMLACAMVIRRRTTQRPLVWEVEKEKTRTLVLLGVGGSRRAQKRYGQDIATTREAILGLGQDSHTITIFAKVRELLRVQQGKPTSFSLYGDSERHTLCPHTSNLAASQLVFLCVGRRTWPQGVSYVATSQCISSGNSTTFHQFAVVGPCSSQSRTLQ